MIKVDRFVITADPHCFILQEQKERQDGKNTGEKFMDNLGYYNSVENAVQGAIKILTREKVSETKLVDLKQAVNDIKKIKESVTKALGDV